MARPLPELPGVEHRYVTVGGVRLHVAEAGAAEPVVFLHGFPQHWWEWRHQIGPLAAEGYRVLAPDLRGAGWSDAPRGPYRKSEMALDLLAVLDELGVQRVKIAAHDWGGPVAFELLLRAPERVSGFAGFNTLAPWLRLDLGVLGHLWRFWYQAALLAPPPTQRAISPR